MTPESARRLRALIDAHDDMFRAIRDANHHIDDPEGTLGQVIQAHDKTIAAALAANRAALDLLARLEAGE